MFFRFAVLSLDSMCSADCRRGERDQELQRRLPEWPRGDMGLDLAEVMEVEFWIGFRNGEEPAPCFNRLILYPTVPASDVCAVVVI